MFDVDDYAADARVSDANGNGLLDPQDLIRAFSDGVDGDANGYIDDIAGWNFLDDDNDPFDEVSYGHGTGEAEDSTAEADNGGDLGTCPNCMVLPVRVGDSFIADSNLFAQGVVFAVDSGAHVVQEALGAVNNTSFARAAIEYAWSRNVPVIASAADEESFHHNVPAANRHTITVNSVTRFAEQSGFTMSPPSYLYLNGCTNYGGNIAVAIESSSCSSEATGRGSGIAGLLISAALDRVDAGMLLPRADRSDRRRASAVRERGAAAPHHDGGRHRFLGRPGRVVRPLERSASSRSATRRSRAGTSTSDTAAPTRTGRSRRWRGGNVPPEADLLPPDWWETLDPVRTPVVDGHRRCGARRAPRSYGWELAAGCGVQPTEDRFAPIASAASLTAPVGPGMLASWSIADTALRCAIDPAAVPQTRAERHAVARRHARRVHRHAAAARHRRRRPARRGAAHALPASRSRSAPGLPAGDRRQRRAVAVLRPAARQGAAPRRAQRRAASSWSCRPPTAPSSRCAPTADALPGWPVHTDPLPLHTGSRAFASGALPTTFYESVGGGAAAADLDGDRRTEVVAGTLAGKLYVWDQDGDAADGLPGPHRAALLGTQRPRPLQPPAAGLPRRARARRSRWRRRARDHRRRHGPPRLRLARRRESAAGLAGAGRRSHADGVDRSGQPPRRAEDGRRPVGGAPGHQDRLDPGRGRAARRRQARRRRRQQRGVSRAGELLVRRQHRRSGRSSRSACSTSANGRLHAIPAGGNDDPGGAGNPAGPELPGWPVRIGVLAAELLPWIEGVPGSPVLADVDGDGRLEVGIASRRRAGVHPARGRHLVLRHGTRRPAADAADGPRSSSAPIPPPPTPRPFLRSAAAASRRSAPTAPSST